MNAMERLNVQVMQKGPLLAGLDPDIKKIMDIYKRIYGKKGKSMYLDQDFIEKVMWQFCCDYIDAVKDKVAAIKINIAFFEAYALENLFRTIVALAKGEGLFVIADVNRADIGNQYAEAFLQKDSYIDAITINPYFGDNGVKPFLNMAKENEKAVFVLVKTSNASSHEIQDLELKDGRKVYQQVAELVKGWGEYTKMSDDEKYSLVGAVVGATHPKEAEMLRKQLPKTFFLVTGYGAQGATAMDAAVSFDKSCGGAIVNSSRGLMFAYKRNPWKRKISIKDWDEATLEAVVSAQKELREAILSTVR